MAICGWYFVHARGAAGTRGGDATTYVYFEASSSIVLSNRRWQVDVSLYSQLNTGNEEGRIYWLKYEDIHYIFYHVRKMCNVNNVYTQSGYILQVTDEKVDEAINILMSLTKF